MVVMETLNTFQPRTFTPAFLSGDTEEDRYRPRAYTPAPGETAGGQTDGQQFVPHTFTPAYISEELDEVYEEEERQRPWTTYGKMNEWTKASGGRDMRSGVPVTRSDGNWRKQATENGLRPNNDNFNVRFRESYADLTNQIAYRFPNPGLPRLRQGSIGGSWRHIKEVLGHGGSRVCYVDGLVAKYDEEQFNQDLANQSTYRPHLRRQVYSPNRGIDFRSIRQAPREEIHLPAVEELPMLSASEKARKMAIQSPNKHKGVYAYNKTPV